MRTTDLPFFEESHRTLSARVEALCRERLGPLSGTELEDPPSSAVEYMALLGQEQLFDPALGRALEGEAPRPDLRSLVLLREQLGLVSGLADAAFGAQVGAMFPIALSGDEDQRAIHLPGMSSGATIVGLALLDGQMGGTEVRRQGTEYILTGSKAMVPLAPIADRFVVLARHAEETPARFSLFVVEASVCDSMPDEFVSSLPVGQLRFGGIELDEESRLGGEGMGLVIAQAALDMFRLPTSAACIGLGEQALTRGLRELAARGTPGRRPVDQQGAQTILAEARAALEAARALICQAAYRRDTSNSREVVATASARMLAQRAGEDACRAVADLIGIRGLVQHAPWERLLGEVRAFRLETEFLEKPQTAIAQTMLKAIEGTNKS